MRSLIFLVFVCICCCEANAQNFSVFNIDASNFPVMKADFYAFDANGVQQNPSASDITVTEDGITRKVLSASCPPLQSIPKISLAMSLDVSGSMASADFGSPVEFGKSTMSTLVPLIGDPASEFALQTCNSVALLYQDFTTNRAKILSVIASLSANGGNDFVEHLLNPKTGILNIAKNGKYKHIAVLYTDAWWYPLTPNELQRCIDTCSKYGIIFYALIYSRPEAEPNGIKSSLQKLANATGGAMYDGIDSKQAAKNIAENLQKATENSSPCQITWQSGIICPSTQHTITFSWNSVTTTASYSLPPNPTLSFSPKSMILRSKQVGKPFDTTIYITANIGAISILNVTSSNPAFDINPKSFSLAPGGSQALTIRYTPPDSTYNSTEFSFTTNFCPSAFDAAGGFPGKAPKQPTLKLILPNGGEQLPVGSDTIISWTGIPTTDTVSLDYSTDGGKTWIVVAPKATGGRYPWHVPNTPGVHCLARVTQSDGIGAGDSVVTLIGHVQEVTSVSWSPDGAEVVSASWDSIRPGIIWDSYSGNMLVPLQTKSLLETVSWSPNGQWIAGVGSDSNVLIFDAGSGDLVKKLKGHIPQVYSVAWSPDGTRLATGGEDQTLRIWDPVAGTLLRTITMPATTYIEFVSGLSWSPDGTKIVTLGNGNSPRIWDVNTGALLKTFSSTAFNYTGVAWSPQGSQIASANGADGGYCVWDTSKITPRFWLGGSMIDWNVSWSADAKYLLMSGNFDNLDLSYARVLDPLTGKTIRELGPHHFEARDAKWSPDAIRIATAGDDYDVRIWGVPTTKALQQDQSDAEFAIIAPQPQSEDLDMGKVFVQSNLDSSIQSFVRNTGTYAFRVDSIAIAGADASQFFIASGIPPYIVEAGGSHHIEIVFTPTSTGIKSATILIYTQSGILTQKIQGEGILPSLAVMGNIIDFGQVPIGSYKDTTITFAIQNISPAPVNVTTSNELGPDVKQFSLQAGGAPFTLSPGAFRTVTLRFAPHFIGRTSGRVGFDYGANSPAVLLLFGQGVGGLISIKDDSGYAGDHKQIPITLEKVPVASVQSAATNFTARIAYDNTLLSADSGIVSKGSTYDTVTVNGSLGVSNTIGNLFFFVTLSQTKISPLDIINFTWLDGSGAPADYDVETESGTFHILDACGDSLIRGFMATGEIAPMTITPNPSSGIIHIQFKTPEAGRTQLAVMNLLGERVATISDGELGAGQHSMDFNTNNLSGGAYFVMLQSSALQRLVRIEVGK